MDFSFTETQLELQRAARQFAEKRLRPLVAKMDAEAHYLPELIVELGELGFFGINVPEEHGGIGAEPLTYALVIEEFAKVCPSTSVMLAVHNGLLNEMLLKKASPAQRAKWLPDCATGRCVGAFAITEPGAGSDAAGTKTRAVKDGDRYVLNGTKTFITNADHAHLFIVFAVTAPGARTRGISAFFVEKGTPGFELGKKEDKMGLRASSTRELVFTDARVPAANLIGEENEGFKAAMSLLDGGRIGIGAQSLGIAEAAYQEGLRYSQERKQFDKALSEFQAIQTMLADMATEIEAARYLVYKAAWLKGQGRPHSVEASMAKLFASEMANRVVNRALQIHGGYGYVKPTPIERIYRDQRVTQIYEGTSEIQRLVIARLLTKP
ncbi:MAG TPA: acyl-CoA dehydrogenase family protein [Myxococcales bacterium]|jgi:alkylation response protein AidB-like acyl-CoA dehydrogenase